MCQGDILRASCPSGSIIATKDLSYGTKLTTTCAASNTSAGCCDYDPDDCLTPYAETSQQAACSGKDLCIDLSVAQADTSSCGASYPSLNHYLTMEYYCISGNMTTCFRGINTLAREVTLSKMFCLSCYLG